MARTAFMSLYEQLYERERNRAMTPGYVTRQIDSAAGHLSTGERARLEEIHQRRVEKEESDRALWYGMEERNRLAIKQRLQLAGGTE